MNQTLTVFSVFSGAVQIAFFFFFVLVKKRLFSKNCTFRMRVYHRNKRHAICRRYCCLLHIYSSATVISFLTTGVEESEKGTGKTTTGFVLKSLLERIPVLYCCASMEALWARKAPLQCFLEQACYLTGSFHYAPYFGWSLKVCDNMHVGRVQQADQGALGGICFKKKN